jgi:hypothetical protein
MQLFFLNFKKNKVNDIKSAYNVFKVLKINFESKKTLCILCGIAFVGDQRNQKKVLA